MNMKDAALTLGQVKQSCNDAQAQIKDLTLRLRKAAGVAGFPTFAILSDDGATVAVINTLDGSITEVPIFDGTKVELEDGPQPDVNPALQTGPAQAAVGG